jgi:hypothetical protein
MQITLKGEVVMSKAIPATDKYPRGFVILNVLTEPDIDGNREIVKVFGAPAGKFKAGEEFEEIVDARIDTVQLPNGVRIG